jgi:hypothetical protein
MMPARFEVPASQLKFPALAIAIAFFWGSAGAAAETRHAAKIDSRPMAIMDTVVAQQWPHTLPLVNAPEVITRLNPGHCVRIAVLATGDGRDGLLQRTQIAFRVRFAGVDEDHGLAPLAAFKQIKPEGGDAVTQILGAAGVKNPIASMASMGVAGERWCVPEGARDGKAVFECSLQIPAGQQPLKTLEIEIESYESGSKNHFKNAQDVADFMMTYYRHPNPARLFAVLESLAADEKMRSAKGAFENSATFLGAALKADPAAEKDFFERVSAESGLTRAFGLLILHNQGFNIDQALNAMGEEEREKFTKLPSLSDPYDFTSGPEIPTHFDMLWSIFGATGTFEPVQKISSALAWHSEYEEFVSKRSEIHALTDLTPQLWRGVSYGAAGWSLGSFQRNDPLAADYIEFIPASSDTPEIVKTELAGLSTNPAFRRQ